MPATAPPSANDIMQRAGQALQRGDTAAALGLLEQAALLEPSRVEIHLNKALILRRSGDFVASIVALDEVLRRDGTHFVALLSKGAVLEEIGRPRQAAKIYREALAVAPEAARLPPAMAPALNQARASVAADTEALQAFLRAETAATRAAFPDAALSRFDESLDIYAGAKRAYVQRPLLLHYSQLPAIPFHDRALFPWLPELEAATGIIADELADLLRDNVGDFVPYIQYQPGVPVRQWGELNHSRRWSSYFLWENGVRHDEACRRCPRTAALMERLPLMRQAGSAPTVVFSALQPHTHIPPHTGSSTARLLVHLPLILPGPARFRVGNETREWRRGHAWVFDDTIEHEAWNDADQMRVILILDVWNPLLSDAERALISAMMAARRAYYGPGLPTSRTA